ncbi:MAG: metallophosphoesterase [Rhodobiaceae bacterium]|nr:metallophosphoesterase [Rhodobiaceae bacterium]MCC0048395.1 metallophosphoesterase [Rhodobiaceae bacterium]
MFVIAHLSDPHLPISGRLGAGEYFSKRLIGYVNWIRGRHTIHRGDIAEALVADLLAQNPDHIAMTGDLVNVGANREWEPARVYMRALGTPDNVSAVPGNHDAYVGGALAGMRETYAPYTSLDKERVSATASPLPPMPDLRKWQDKDGYPFLRRRGQIAIVGISTAVPTAPFMATGKIGREQLSGLDSLLKSLRGSRLFRVILIHHPPTHELAHGRRGLDDANALKEIIARHGAELILHGHNHTATISAMAGPRTSVPVIGVPSASARPTTRKPGAGYALFHIGGQAGAWNVTFIRRGLSSAYEEDGEIEIVEQTRQILPVSSPVSA